jgi:hypothetical protein
MKLTKIFAIFTIFMMLTVPAMADTAATATAGATAGSAVAGDISPNQEITINNPATDLKQGRGFAIPGEVLFPGTPGYFGDDTPGHEFMPLSKITMFTTIWDVQAAKNMLKGWTGSKQVNVRALMATDDTEVTDKIYVSIAKPTADDIQQRGFVTVASTSKSSISADVFAKMLVAASENGGNYIMFTAEGVNKTIVAWGAGIGATHTNTDLKGSGNGSAGSSVFGAGLTYGEARYQKRPYLQGIILRIPSLIAAPLPVVDTPEKIANAVPAEKKATLIGLFREKGWFGLEKEAE